MTVCPSDMAKLTVPIFFIDDSLITVVDQHCYLGFLLNSDCTDNADIKNTSTIIICEGKHDFAKKIWTLFR
jgi:hypothetical protein